MHELNQIEIIALKGIQAREREINEKYLGPLKNDFKQLLEVIAARTGVEFGKTHLLDTDNLRVIPITTHATEPLVEPVVQPAEPAQDA